MRRLPLACWLVLALTAPAAVGPGQPGDDARKTVTITEKENGKPVTVPAGGALLVRLRSNRTTGYTWSIHSIDSSALQAVGKPTYERPDNRRAGAEGHQLFRFNVTA